MNMKERVGSMISAPLGVLLIIFFFLPWLSLKCNGTEMARATGWQLARGDMKLSGMMGGMAEMAEGTAKAGGVKVQEDESKKPEPRPWFLACLFLPIVVVLVGGLGAAGAVPHRPAAALLLLLALAGVVFMVLAAVVDYNDDPMMEEMKKETAQKPTPGPATTPGGMNVNFTPPQFTGPPTFTTDVATGWWLSLVGYLLVAACGVANLALPKINPPPGSGADFSVIDARPAVPIPDETARGEPPPPGA